MPSIFSKLKRSSSPSSSHSDDNKHRRSSTASSSLTFEDEPSPISDGARLQLSASSGSVFVENFDESTSPSKSSTHTPSRSKGKPASLELPHSNTKSQAIGTPKLVLTEEGSDSPRSFNDSPAFERKTRAEVVGLGLGPSISAAEDDLDTPTGNEAPFSLDQQTATMSTTGRTVEDGRDRADSITSSTSQHEKHSRAGSLVSRVAAKVHPISPPTEGLMPVDSRTSIISKKSRRSKDRRRSVTSTMSGQSGIAAALAKSGLHIASPAGDDLIKTHHVRRGSGSQKRSPFLSRKEGIGEDGPIEDDLDEDDDDEYDDDDSDSDIGDDLPVTGFAVASNRRNADFHALFPTVDEGDYLIEDILVQGRLYVSENHICFHANIFGWVTDYTFASLISRDSTYDVMMNIWRLCNPNAVMSTVSLSQVTNAGSRAGSVAGEDVETTGGKATKGHAPTQCACGKEGKHYSETALETTFPSTPEKVFNLMFDSGWFKTFLSENQKLRGSKLLTRSISYIKPLNGSIGPKQTKCHITDEHEHLDYDDYIVMITTTRTPDVPSGGVFSVKTKTCFMWAGANSTKVIVTTTVEWTGKSWVKGIIEKSAIDGQKTYHDDLEVGMRAYMKENPSEFAGADGVDEVEEDTVVDEKAKEASPTEAQEYAARARRDRQDRDLFTLQGGIDSVVAGVKALLSGIRSVLDSVFDILSDTPLGTQLMGAVIIALVISNIWTYMSMDSRSHSARRAKRIGRSSFDDEVTEAVRMVLESRSLNTPAAEAQELMRILDNVDIRTRKLRHAVESVAAEGAGTVSDLD
ncbi:hypothetical protein IAR55_006247 [Kwoniella newhampshirensis]|uniref:VASt domain-containing protein n=1 Tax=Kwoniella newhampshirensis TaxID=1651941 RepID=A0AAW0YUW8_9TREE